MTCAVTISALISVPVTDWLGKASSKWPTTYFVSSQMLHLSSINQSLHLWPFSGIEIIYMTFIISIFLKNYYKNDTIHGTCLHLVLWQCLMCTMKGVQPVKDTSATICKDVPTDLWEQWVYGLHEPWKLLEKGPIITKTNKWKPKPPPIILKGSLFVGPGPISTQWLWRSKLQTKKLWKKCLEINMLRDTGIQCPQRPAYIDDISSRQKQSPELAVGSGLCRMQSARHCYCSCCNWRKTWRISN